MFDQYAYFSSIINDTNFPEIKTIARVSGLMGMEEAMEKIRSVNPLILLIEDDADGYLDLEDGNLDNGYHSFSIIDTVKQGDSSDRYRALTACMTAGLKIINQMLTDSREYKNAVYGLDRSRISYQRIGPLLNNTWGYIFTYTIRNERFTLV